MTSTIYVSRNEQAIDAEVMAQVADNILIKVETQETSITIEQIHSLVASLTTAPSMPRFVWIKNADRMTVPAQNALLKILEEPPTMTEFILTTFKLGGLLETIRSRCVVQKLDQKLVSSGNNPLTIIKSALQETPGDRVNMADSLGRKREELIAWVEDCLVELDSHFRSTTAASSLSILSAIGKLLDQASRDLRSNVSPPLVMQNLFLSLPHVKQ